MSFHEQRLSHINCGRLFSPNFYILAGGGASLELFQYWEGVLHPFLCMGSWE